VRQSERGQSLLEVVICCAIVAVVAGAVGAALVSASHRFGPDPVAQTLQFTVANEMRVAVDLAKYRGAIIPATTVATTAPMPSTSPLPIHLALSASTSAAGAVTLTVTASSDNDSTKSATLSQTIAAPAPVPGSSITGAAGPAPQ
jgi:hypothetical protein